MDQHWPIIERKIAESFGKDLDIQRRQSVSGGSINRAYILRGRDTEFFVKLNQSQRVDMFAAEFDGLIEIQNSNTIKVPTPYCFGVASDVAFLAMELLSFSRLGDPGSAQFAHDLAAMHRVTQSQFGWYRDNTIGSTVQINTCMDNWGQFWQQQRLGYQLQLAAENGYRGKLQQRGEKLTEKVTDFFDHNPVPSLLHGDLWSGNFSMSQQGDPVIYDPALYYGDRETDLAMTELFGGLSSDFYSAYHDYYPLDSGYSRRKTLYNLYHILNHLNLFGSGYLHQAQDMIDRLLSEV